MHSPAVHAEFAIDRLELIDVSTINNEYIAAPAIKNPANRAFLQREDYFFCFAMILSLILS